jgi:hypothetical protein
VRKSAHFVLCEACLVIPQGGQRHHPMDSAAVRIRLRDAQIRLASAELQLSGDSPHEWKYAAEISVSVGIAAGDAICGHVLGYKPSGDAHIEAMATLRPAGNTARADILACTVFPKELWRQIWSNNPC